MSVCLCVVSRRAREGVSVRSFVCVFFWGVGMDVLMFWGFSFFFLNTCVFFGMFVWIGVAFSLWVKFVWLVYSRPGLWKFDG